MIRSPFTINSLLITSLLESFIASYCSEKMFSDGSHTVASLVISMFGIDSSSYSLALGFLDGKYLVTPFNYNGMTRGSFLFNRSSNLIACVFSSGSSAKNLEDQ